VSCIGLFVILRILLGFIISGMMSVEFGWWVMRRLLICIVCVCGLMRLFVLCLFVVLICLELVFWSRCSVCL